MAKGRKTAALLGVLGAGALAAKQLPYLGRVDLDAVPKPTRPERETRIPEYPVLTDDQRKESRKKLYETESSLRGTLRTEDYVPILSGDGLPIKTGGMKKGGKVSASSRGDGIAQRGKTKGRML
jgi:hypothetical protein